jgi:poly-gamma-glutamate capsule biosynthesis protein CapA/YwtB (metallophosphatase superfamily)
LIPRNSAICRVTVSSSGRVSGAVAGRRSSLRRQAPDAGTLSRFLRTIATTPRRPPAAGAFAGVLIAAHVAAACPPAASAQEPPGDVPARAPEADPVAPGSLIRPPRAVAPGGRLRARVRGLALPGRLEIHRAGRWRRAGTTIRRSGGEATLRTPMQSGLLRIRARGADGRVTPSKRVRVRPLDLAAVGDVNLGDGPGAMMARHGFRYPWTSVGRVMARADLAFANLECAVSRGGVPQEKQYVFRGHPGALRAMRRHAGIDVVNLANNHAGDYGDGALLDTIRHVRSTGMTAVGAGASEDTAYRPRIVNRLGLRVAFVGFSTILPFEFRAVGRSPGTAWAFPERVRRTIARARRDSDVVIATFHWGQERATHESAGQRWLAHTALEAGATAVIGAHPHVLQPVRRSGGRLIAYSLGNFVFAAVSPGTTRTAILRVQLGRRRVVGARLLRATIHQSRPILHRP